jgi:hypothetical protein
MADYQEDFDDASEGKPAAPKEKASAPKEKVVKNVKMVRDPEQYPAPHTADVHPNEVKNYALGGWMIE